jgi:hypothetical protein
MSQKFKFNLQRQAVGFLKKSLCKEGWGIVQSDKNQLRIMTGLLTGHIFELGLVNNSECDRCKQAFDRATHSW